MLCAARYENARITKDSGGECAYGGANMTLSIDIAVIQHRMRLAANHSIARWFALDQDCGNPLSAHHPLPQYR
jgi:hypothetical protein